MKRWSDTFRYFDLNEHHYAVNLHGEDTRSGFKHVAHVFEDGGYRFTSQCYYYNRTWERYQFETLLHKVIQTLTEYETRDYSKSKRGRKIIDCADIQTCKGILDGSIKEFKPLS